MNYGGLDSSIEMGFEKEGDGYAFLSNDQQQIRLMILRKTAADFLTLTRKTVTSTLADDDA